MKHAGNYTRAEFLRKAAQIPGIYVPSLYEVTYQEDGTIVKYPSVEEYMKRKEKFQTVKEEDACPFTEQQELPFPTDQKGGGLPC